MALALFDLDNTLLAGDSDHAWGEFLISRELVDPAQHKAKNDQFYQDYLDGRLDILAYQRFALSPIVGKSADELSALHQSFMEEIILPMVLDTGRETIESHRKKGDDLVIITATNDFVTKPIANLLGVDTLIATRAELIDGRYTGEITGTPSYSHGKVERLREWMEENNKSLAGSIFYSDSHNDIPLLELVDTAVCVDPDQQLRTYAEEKNWSIISFR